MNKNDLNNEVSLGRPSEIFSWCLFDFAGQGYPTVITTFVFAAYFAEAVAPDLLSGTTYWGYTVGIAGLLVAFLSPILGAIADQTGRRKPWLLAFTLVSIISTALLWFTRPLPDDLLWALTLVALSSASFEVGTVFYNAMLPDLVPRTHLGRVSGWAWGMGYAGGLLCLVVALLGFVKAEPPPFGLDQDSAEHVRVTAILVGVWFTLFAIPLFLVVPDKPHTRISLRRAISKGLKQLFTTALEIRRHANTARFLLARMIYIDGVNTMFVFGGIYAAGTIGMDLDEIILLGIALNVAAGGGAVVFAWLDDWIGSKLTILLSLGALIITLGVVLTVQTKTQFWFAALTMSVFFGPVQAASRTLMARLAPIDMRNEMFGLFAVSGKATAFAGPMLVAWITAITNNQRLGMAIILLFLLTGWFLMRSVEEPR